MGLMKQLSRRKSLKQISNEASELGRILSTLDLIGLGVGCTLGVGVYVLPGMVAKELAGPAVLVSFFIAALTSILAGLCFAEFGARVPKAGSAYIYSYVTVGECVAFIIGWSLIMEYVIGTASVARGLSIYLDTLVGNPMEAFYRTIYEFKGSTFLSEYFDLFSFGICILVTLSLAVGVKESLVINNVLTCVNVAVVLFVIFVGSSKVDLSNWSLKESQIPAWAGKGGFFPYGVLGAVKGAATCFYGYIGFDVIATSAEEVENPQKSLPLSIIVSLIVVFLAYSGLSAVLTLMWPYYLQDVDAPIPFVFNETGLEWAAWVIAVGGIFGLLASMYSGMFPLPRIVYSMANDGLLFGFLGRVHETFQTPFIGTLISGVVTALMASLFTLKHLIDLLSLVTLLAYSIVSACVLLLRYREEYTEPENVDDILEHSHLLSKKIRVTCSGFVKHYFSSRSAFVPTPISSFVATFNTILYCVLCILVCFVLEVLEEGTPLSVSLLCILLVLMSLCLLSLSVQPTNINKLTFKVPFLPLVPALSLFINIYLMFSLDINTWIQFSIWLLIGLSIYMGYGLRHSRLRSAPHPVEYEIIRSDDEFHPSPL